MAHVLTPTEVASRCRADGEFMLAARYWTGGYRIGIGDHITGVTIVDGEVHEGVPDAGSSVIGLTGSDETWAPMLQATPPRLANTVSVMVSLGLELDADPLLWWQYLPATERLCELLRDPAADQPPLPGPPQSGAIDAPTGRYVHVELDGLDHRIYYEEAGQGIPLLLQHTAGSHGVQWRHLFEQTALTDRFRLIAYDLPFHGKSLPPTGRRWWDETYRLTGDFLRQVPVGLADVLALEQPAFMGCSVGGLLALDLALHHGDLFRAVVSVEGALHIGSDVDGLFGMSHPQVSNMAKAKMMEGLCSPTSPVPYVKEVSQVYSAGWPPLFLGDLWYYLVDYDIRERAHEIDTSQCAVHILNGEYDYSGTIAKGIAAHEAIAGSTHTAMDNIGHFPMTENPELFMTYLSPILDSIAAATTS
jgi:pimeloyl-ACP methyl ester carboxylesterase